MIYKEAYKFVNVEGKLKSMKILLNRTLNKSNTIKKEYLCG